MKIAILSHVDPGFLDEILSDNILYRPDVLKKGKRCFQRFLKENDICALVISGFLPVDFLSEWRSRDKPRGLVVFVGAGGFETSMQSVVEENAPLPVTPDTDQPAPVPTRKQCIASSLNIQVRQAEGIVSALTCIEKQWIDQRPVNAIVPMGRKSNREHVTFVGAGLVNLISAHFTVRAGMSVRIVEAAPDPRLGEDWIRYGCSSGGANARMFTLSEMDNYNCRHAHRDMNWQFSRSVAQNGWNVCDAAHLSGEEKTWIDDFERIPSWLAESYNQDIFKFSRESKSLWEQWMEEDPELFSDSVTTRDILRIYSDADHLQASLARQDRIGATIRAVSIGDIADEQPILAAAVDRGLVAGGVYVHGFTVNVHRFIAALIERLETGGVAFDWQTRMVSIEQGTGGTVEGISLEGGEVVRGNIVISPGAYGNGVLQGTSAHRQIAGVLGAWLTLPDREGGLRNSLKLARKGHIVEDANVTVALDENGERVAIIGSGYGFTGFDPNNIDQNLLGRIYSGIQDTARHYFPESYAQSVAEGSLDRSLKYCVRPWTPTGLGVFETLRAANDDKLIVVGGHNTGGFAQAPATGMAVIASIRGRQHDMHRDYRPNRFRSFLGA